MENIQALLFKPVALLTRAEMLELEHALNGMPALEHGTTLGVAFGHLSLDAELGALLPNFEDRWKALLGAADDAERRQVQLAGCLMAAEGATQEPAKQGDYGWSPAYQAVLELRRKFDALPKPLEFHPDAFAITYPPIGEPSKADGAPALAGADGTLAVDTTKPVPASAPDSPAKE